MSAIPPPAAPRTLTPRRPRRLRQLGLAPGSPPGCTASGLASPPPDTWDAAAGLLDAAAATGRFDLVSGFAAPLPIAVITDLLGIPDSRAEDLAP